MESLLSMLQWWSLMAVLLGAGVEAPLVIEDDASVRAPTGKLWIDDYVAYVNSQKRQNRDGRPPGHTPVVGHCRQVALSPEEAQDRALRDAAGQIYDRMKARLHPSLRGADERARIVADMVAEMAGGRYVLDAYSAFDRRHYGVIWSHSVLVDASSNRIASLVDRHNGRVRERKANAARTFASVVGLSILILLTYAGVNAWTKGYFRGRLRAGAVLALVGGWAVLMWMLNAAP